MDALAHSRTYNGWRIGKTICWICKEAVPTTLAKMGDGVCHRCQRKYFVWPSKALREVKNAVRRI